MSVSLCCLSFDRSSLPALENTRKEAERWTDISLLILVVGGGYAFVYGAVGFGLSLFTGGQLTTVGALLFSSPVFCIAMGVTGVVCAVAWTVQKVASHLFEKIQREIPAAEGDRYL